MIQDYSLRILHIDDDPNLTRLISTLLRARGYTVASLHDPVQALDLIADENFRIVILDIDMPGVDGIDLLQRIKSVDSGTAVIMLTGYVSISNVLRSMRNGAAACFFKPQLDVAALVECIQEIHRNASRWRATLARFYEAGRRERLYFAENSVAQIMGSAT